MVIAPSADIPEETLCVAAGSRLAATVRRGKPVIVDDLSELSETLAAKLGRQKVESILLAPLHFGSDIIGAFFLYDVDQVSEFTPEQLSVAEALSHHAAIGVVNARSFTEQRRISETLQQSFIPSRPPPVPGVTFGV